VLRARRGALATITGIAVTAHQLSNPTNDVSGAGVLYSVDR
jgi:hypothetical protein